MTQTRKIDNVFYFNGKINNKSISLYDIYNKENDKILLLYCHL